MFIISYCGTIEARMASALKLTGVLAVASTGVLLAGTADLWRQERAAVVKAYQAKDYAAMRDLLLKQHADFPSVRGSLYNLALAEALLGHKTRRRQPARRASGGSRWNS